MLLGRGRGCAALHIAFRRLNKQQLLTHTIDITHRMHCSVFMHTHHVRHTHRMHCSCTVHAHTPRETSDLHTSPSYLLYLCKLSPPLRPLIFTPPLNCFPHSCRLGPPLRPLIFALHTPLNYFPYLCKLGPALETPDVHNPHGIVIVLAGVLRAIMGPAACCSSSRLVLNS